MISTLAVIGSHSFSGNALVSHATSIQKCIGFSRSSSLPKCYDSFSSNGAISNFTNYIVNINEDVSSLIDKLNENEVEYVINYAAQSMVGQSWDTPEDWYETNIVSFAKLLTRITRETKVKKFIHFTTPEVYGSTQGWVKENFHFSPNTPYAISRAAGDWHLRALHENFGFPVLFTRAANVYGEYQKLYRIIPRVVFSALTGRKFPLQGGGKSIRSFIHIEDVNNALLKIIEFGKAGESYHISTQQLISIYDLVGLIANKLNVEVKDIIELEPERLGKDFAYQLDSEKIRTELGWSDKISLSDGIDRTIKWVVSNLEELSKMPINYEHRR